MRLLVISDVHGHTANLRRALDSQPTARTVLFLGDGLREVEAVAQEYTDRTFYMVPGNCDWRSEWPAVREETFGGKKILFTHGHKYDVKYGLYKMELAARQVGVDVALFGHTHQPLIEYADGLYLVNPGSLREGRYAYVDITSGGIMPVLLTLG